MAVSHLFECKICGPEQGPTGPTMGQCLLRWQSFAALFSARGTFCGVNDKTLEDKHATTHSGENPRENEHSMSR